MKIQWSTTVCLHVFSQCLSALAPCWNYLGCFIKRFIYLFIFREGKGGRKRGRETWYVRETMIHCLCHAPNWGPGPQPKYVPWLGIELVTFQFPGRHSCLWATSARTELPGIFLIKDSDLVTGFRKQRWISVSVPLEWGWKANTGEFYTYYKNWKWVHLFILPWEYLNLNQVSHIPPDLLYW